MVIGAGAVPPPAADAFDRVRLPKAGELRLRSIGGDCGTVEGGKLAAAGRAEPPDCESVRTNELFSVLGVPESETTVMVANDGGGDMLVPTGEPDAGSSALRRR